MELVVVNLTPAHNLTYDWTNNLPAISNPVVSPLVSTMYTVTVTNQYGCTDVAGTFVDVLTVNVSVEVTGKDTICLGESTRLKATATGGGLYTYAWSPAGSLTGADTAEPVAMPTQTETYTVTVTDVETGCTATGSVTIYFRATECQPPYIFVPKAFTPNGDGHNDFFRVRSAVITKIYFIVYNRWGEEVYRTEDVNHLGWDGRFRGVAATPDAYGWYLEAWCGNEEGPPGYVDKGNVTLLK